MKQLILTVGNGMMGDDAAGVLLAQMLQRSPLEGWEVLDGGSAPENVLHLVREMTPQRVLLVDAVDMDLPPGSIRLMEEERLDALKADIFSNGGEPLLLTTHTLPLTFLIESLREFVPQVEFLGIQPDVVAFGFPMTPAIQDAVTQVYAALQSGQEGWQSL